MIHFKQLSSFLAQMIKITPITDEDAGNIAQIAAPIWREHFTPIIGSQQVEYMLEKFQSESAIRQQLAQGYEYNLVSLDALPAGYIAVQQQEKTLFISKFYLSSDFRGQGIARHMMDKVHQIATEKSCQQLELTVNKFNTACQIYLKLGFTIVESIKIDIGSGYIMDDYRMVKALTV